MDTRDPHTCEGAGASVSMAADAEALSGSTAILQPDSPRYHRGQRYDFEGIEPHTRRDGTLTLLAVWVSFCAECGEPFRFRTPLRAGRFQPNRRCAAHKRPGVRV
jgi:hypothetical protein